MTWYSDLYAAGAFPEYTDGMVAALHTPYGEITVDRADTLAFVADHLSYEDLCQKYYERAAVKYGYAEIKAERGGEKD